MPLSDTVAKGKLSAYQRWEMTSFEEKKPAGKGVSESVAAANRDELQQLKIRAQKEGFAKGFEEGHQAGLNTGMKDMQQQIADFSKIGTQFAASLQQAENIVAQDVLDLALDLAKAMLKNVLDINPELVIPIVQQAISGLPSVQLPAQLFLHPADATLVAAHIGDELDKAGWVIVNDPRLNRGDCRIETLQNQINASLSSRWKQLTDALGRNNNWYVNHSTDSRR